MVALVTVEQRSQGKSKDLKRRLLVICFLNQLAQPGFHRNSFLGERRGGVMVRQGTWGDQEEMHRMVPKGSGEGQACSIGEDGGVSLSLALGRGKSVTQKSPATSARYSPVLHLPHIPVHCCFSASTQNHPLPQCSDIVAWWPTCLVQLWKGDGSHPSFASSFSALPLLLLSLQCSGKDTK